MARLALLFLAVALAAASADARPHRSAAAIAAFKRANPCPSTGLRRGKCPGYVVDHVLPLCAGGEDAPRNMQWQTTVDARAKDVTERRMCAAKRQRPVSRLNIFVQPT